MHAVTNTQSKKGNGLGMDNVMYDKRFIIFPFLYSFICSSIFFCRALSTNFLIILLYKVWTAFSICSSQRLKIIHFYKESIIFGTELMI